MNYVDYAIEPEELAYMLFLLDNVIESIRDVLKHSDENDFDEEFYDTARRELHVARKLKSKLNPEHLRKTYDSKRNIPPTIFKS